jgi:hypothetical protein
MIQRGVDSRYDEKKADDQKDESFDKSFHVGGAFTNPVTMTENRSKG